MTRNTMATANAATATHNAANDHGFSRSQYSGFATFSPSGITGVELIAD